MDIKVEWMVQKGYFIEAHLASEGLSFDSFDIISKADGKAAESVKKKIIAKLMKDLRSDFQEGYGVDIRDIRYGVYCIGVGTGFEIDYNKRSSRIVYIGSGSVYTRIKSHLQGKLFDFIRELKSVPLRFYIVDLTEYDAASKLQRKIEEALLKRFKETIDDGFPLLNARSACSKAAEGLGKGWDRPLQKERGRSMTRWLIKPYNPERWKGAL